MRRRLSFLFAILFLLFLYTAINISLIWPNHWLLVWLFTPPFFALLIGWQFLYRSDSNILETKWFYTLAWVGSVSMGLWATFVLLTLPLDLIDIVALAFGRNREVASSGGLLLAHTLPLTVIGFSGGITTLGFLQAMRGPKLRELTVGVGNLPQALEGLTIVQMSDLHVGPTIRGNYVANVIEKINSVNPDLIAITGDTIDGSVEALNEHIQGFKNLKAKYGVYLATGNHDYYWGAQSWLAKFEELGIHPLINENKVFRVGDARFLVAGIPDPVGAQFIPEHRPDVAKAGESAEKSDLKILLSHRPEYFEQAEKADFDLQLSGHTHAGQFFPWNLIVGLAYKYYRGLNRHGKLWVNVNAGTGYWGPPHRFLVPSEISVLRVTKEKTSNV